MKELRINRGALTPANIEALMELCPFGAFERQGDTLTVTAACKMCGICVRRGPQGCVELIETAGPQVDKAAWRGIAVFADMCEGPLHPVSLELAGKARELAAVTGHPVTALLMGHNVHGAAQTLIAHGVDEVYVYDHEQLADFTISRYAAVFADFVERTRPSSVLVGATNAGRSLAPRVAARFRTGLTADCTMLEMKPDTDLVQIRPAFGGNIMARIVTPNHRPQFCTVRYRIFSAAPRDDKRRGRVADMALPADALHEPVRVLGSREKERFVDISEADVIVAAGRGVKDERGFELIARLADELGALTACTRPHIESGRFDPRLQIGLSGRTVKPRLIITAGVSGSVQFAAGMQGSERIIAINSDPAAPIFGIAHDCIVGDLYDVIPRLIDNIAAKSAAAREVRA